MAVEDRVQLLFRIFGAAGAQRRRNEFCRAAHGRCFMAGSAGKHQEEINQREGGVMQMDQSLSSLQGFHRRACRRGLAVFCFLSFLAVLLRKHVNQGCPVWMKIQLSNPDDVVPRESPHRLQIGIRGFDGASVQNRISRNLRKSRFRAHGAEKVRSLLRDCPFEFLAFRSFFRQAVQNAEDFLRQFFPVLFQTVRKDAGDSSGGTGKQAGFDVKGKLLFVLENPGQA